MQIGEVPRVAIAYDLEEFDSVRCKHRPSQLKKSGVLVAGLKI